MLDCVIVLCFDTRFINIVIGINILLTLNNINFDNSYLTELKNIAIM